ncbi:SslE/AcfD family lipoprotein zinc metalloprotease [Photobacterium nomapromontoriensis]|uniref:SslE/AcfD family lipoprotein zinc metalloprotease n=1 Tax=Photobacterium nomapromontoriensis TaxID=2910237 RepID=UPI003D0DBCFA
MNNKLLLTTLVTLALVGCKDEHNHPMTNPDVPTTPLEPSQPLPTLPGGELPDIGVDDPMIAGELSLDSHLVFGASVQCNSQPANAFEFSQRDTVICRKDDLVLATFTDVFDYESMAARTNVSRHRLMLESADEFIDAPSQAKNAIFLIKNMALTTGDQVELTFTSSKDKLSFENLYTNDLTMDEEAFRKLILEEEANDSLTDKAPTTHVPDIEPEVSPGASSDLNSSFISASAEESLQYKPKETILSKAVLTDTNGLPVQGLSYFSASARGKTNALGEFEFLWGEAISFGVDTFELGSVRGNQTSFTLVDLGEEQRGRNAEALLHRYGKVENGSLLLGDNIEAVFAQYPNVINEIISLSLNDKDTELEVGGGLTQVVEAEFDKQFSLGLAANIDQAICGGSCSPKRYERAITFRQAKNDLSNIQADINKLWGIDENWRPVNRFHVFHDSTNFYGSTGSARGQGAVNISNTAFPVMMARNDNNYWLSFGEKKAWDSRGLAYITEAPSKEQPERVGANTATFNLPFISIGELGKGKVMVMGNARYNSVLVCPNGYSWNGWVNSATGECGINTDSDDMKHFFQNTFRYLTNGKSNLTVGTNIPHVYFKRHGQTAGNNAEYVIDPVFGVDTTEQMNSFDGLDPLTMPLLIINGFEYKIHPNGNHYLLPMTADLNQPKLTQEDATALIDYVSRGGSVLVMEAIENSSDIGPLARLLDSAGIAFGMGGSVVPNGNGPSNARPDKPHTHSQYGTWMISRYAAVSPGEGELPKLPYTIDSEGKVIWDFIVDNKPDDKPNLELATWVTENDAGEVTTNTAHISEADHFVKDAKGNVVTRGGEPVIDVRSLAKAKARILDAFAVNGKRTYQECSDSTYHYEVNCLEYRPGNGVPVTGGMYVPAYTELSLGDAEARAMVKAADLGTNIELLFQHERYFRSGGKQGERLSSVDLNRIYQNMTVWLWNNLDYRYEAGKDDELGFERFTQYLNCYTNNQAQGGTECPIALKNHLVSLNMVYGEDDADYIGMVNPSYPLNYMEKPLTRLMLGRSFWDYDVKVDVRQFPGEPSGTQGGASLTLDMANYSAMWYAGNRQPTGQWAVAHQPFTVSVSGNELPVTVTVALHDDLTGREKHELGLRRPPRMTKSMTIASGTETMTVPYGGLIYVQGGASESVNISLSGTVDAPLFDVRKGWVNPMTSPAPIGEVVSSSFVYTAPKNNLNANRYKGDLGTFASELDQFADDLNDFYARDEAFGGRNNRKATDTSMPNNRHHFVNDVAISIGAAHSGYPVMNSSFNVNSSDLSTTPLNDWLLWHEVGHNAAEAPFNVEGATEVVNNILALYMQDKYLGKMTRVEQDIRIAPTFVATENGHAWAAGGAGERLVMFAQLKEWAETEFDITQWYQGDVPAFYDTTTAGMKGWNMFKLMHRLTRNQSEDALNLKGDNMCYGQNLEQSDKLMVCASYVAQTDLTDFFDAWNPGSVANIYPGVNTPVYIPAISQAGMRVVDGMNLKVPLRDPLKIDSITVRQ